MDGFVRVVVACGSIYGKVFSARFCSCLFRYECVHVLAFVVVFPG